jgi:type IV pilus assembly protein PilB
MLNAQDLVLKDALATKGLLSQEQLDQAAAAAEESDVSLQQALVDLKMLDKNKIGKIIAEENGVPYVDLNNYLVDPEVIDIVPEELAKKYLIYPLFKIGDVLTIAMADPSDLAAIDEVTAKCLCEVETCVSAESDIKEAISRVYTEQSVQKLLQNLGTKNGAKEVQTTQR